MTKLSPAPEPLLPVLPLLPMLSFWLAQAKDRKDDIFRLQIQLLSRYIALYTTS